MFNFSVSPWVLREQEFLVTQYVGVRRQLIHIQLWFLGTQEFPVTWYAGVARYSVRGNP